MLANSAEPDEMPNNTAFHLGFHCLSEYWFLNSRIKGVYIKSMHRCDLLPLLCADPKINCHNENIAFFLHD